MGKQENSASEEEVKEENFSVVRNICVEKTTILSGAIDPGYEDLIDEYIINRAERRGSRRLEIR